MAEVPVNGKVLKWARDLRGLSVADAAKLLEIHTDELLEYESGEKKPLVGFLRKMSAKYRINFSSLFMPEPLPPRKLPADYRARFGKKKLSLETLVAIEEISEALEVFKDISSTKRSIVHKPVLSKATLDEDPEEVATRERKKFGVSYETQRSWKSQSKARIQWRRRVEERGIFTYMIALPIDELSGFSLLNDGLAAICINDHEFNEGAKIFTLFHEYCHLLLRKTGISDENNQNRIERFCNKFSASFLMPKQLLLDSVNAAVGDVSTPYDFSSTDIRRLSNYFLVSNSAMALRLEELELAPRGFYGSKRHLWDVPSAPRPVTPNSQPNPVRIKIKRLGRLHASTVLEAVKKKALNSFDASELIGLRPEIFSKIEAALG